MSDLTDEEIEKLTEAVGEIGYVSGALANTREDRLQEDLLRANDRIKEVINDGE